MHADNVRMVNGVRFCAETAKKRCSVHLQTREPRNRHGGTILMNGPPLATVLYVRCGPFEPVSKARKLPCSYCAGWTRPHRILVCFPRIF